MKHNILVATTNPGKMKELSEMLADLAGQIEWHSLRDYPGIREVEEDGDTFADNARKKALGYAQATGLWTLADDSGLSIDALDGDPGVRSARFAAGECPVGKPNDRCAIDCANYEKVLRLLVNVPDDKRTARFQCHLCLAAPGRILLETAGRIEGVINRAPAGDNGFGYDPIFFIPEVGKTAAQLDADRKNSISHRGRAIAALLPQLRMLVTAAPTNQD
jgi:XTP/dITP diphosphohydrolase